MNLLKKVGLTGLAIVAFSALELKAQTVQTDTTKNLTTELTKTEATKKKDPRTLEVGVKAIPAVRYSAKSNELGVGGLLELFSIGTNNVRVGGGVFPNYKVSGENKGKTKNGPEVHITYQPSKKTILVAGASKEGKKFSPFFGAKFMIGGKGRKK